MKLDIFFNSKRKQEEFLNKKFNIQDLIMKDNNILEKIHGIKNIKLKSSYKTIPGYWLEIKFTQDNDGKEIHEFLLKKLNPTQIGENVFFPKENMSIKELEKHWIDKYNLLSSEEQNDVFKLFFQEIKTHLKYDRLDIAYKGLTLILKYNPFFLKKYKRYYILEEIAYEYEERGNMGKTVKALKMHAMLQPTSIEPYLNMSSFYIINGMEEEAFRICKLALEKNPDNPYIISNLLILLMNTGNYGYAIEFLQRTLRKEPENPYLWKMMADILYEIEDNRGAISCYKEALNMAKDDHIKEFKLDIYIGLGDCYYAEEKYIEAIKSYRKALNYNPKDPYILLSLGQIYFFKLKKIDLAFKYTKLLVDDIPGNGYGQYQLGLLYSYIGNTERATWHLYRARNIIPYYEPVHNAISILKKSKKNVY
ncbi:MAG: tetratricopeptide repeat protein [Clostridiales bacterium]|nr:tetratricopeptide repeat protein [Clostridiales bacterium]